MGCIYLLPCWSVLPSTEAEMPFSHHVSAVACLLQKHWQHWKSCLKYFGKLFKNIDFFTCWYTASSKRFQCTVLPAEMERVSEVEGESTSRYIVSRWCISYGEVLSEVLGEVPGEVAGEVLDEVLGEVPGEVPGEVLGEVAAEVPVDTKFRLSHLPVRRAALLGVHTCSKALLSLSFLRRAVNLGLLILLFKLFDGTASIFFILRF